MNPVTRSLTKQLADPLVMEFVARWDEFEDLIIRVYRAKQATPEDAAEHRRLRDWLSQAYLQWQDDLRRHWSHASASGEITREDPFRRLISFDTAEDFVGNWAVMQMLPDAREALNVMLLDLINNP
jgi:hypothetical protein